MGSVLLHDEERDPWVATSESDCRQLSCCAATGREAVGSTSALARGDKMTDIVRMARIERLLSLRNLLIGTHDEQLERVDGRLAVLIALHP